MSNARYFSLPILTKSGFSQQIHTRYKCQIWRKAFREICADIYGQTDERTDLQTLHNN